TAVQHITKAGYDGVEISAIKGMSEHLVLDDWKEQVNEIRSIIDKYGTEILSMEVASLEEERLMKAFEAAAAIGIPVINVGPGGESDVKGDLEESIKKLSTLSKKAEDYGVTLCVKAHIGNAIYNTPTTVQAMEAIDSP